MEKLNLIKTEKIGNSFWKRFNKYVVKSENENDCWGWIGCKSQTGYPVISLGRKYANIKVSRLILNNSISMPFEKAQALHKCDNPECTNPNHLFWGTVKDNMKDMSLKKRGKIPILDRDKTSRCNIKTWHKDEIIELGKTKTCAEIASIFNVCLETIYRFCKKENIKCVDARKFLKPPRKPSKFEEPTLEKEFIEMAKKMTVIELSKFYKCERSTIYFQLKRLNITPYKKQK